jgi:hypothetical protein
MDKRKLVICAVVAVLGVAFAFQVSGKALSIPDFIQSIKAMSFTPKFTVYNGSGCTDQPQIVGLNVADNGQLRQLAKYQSLCASGVTKTLMIFTGIPTNKAESEDMARDMGATLREFASFGVTPLVVAEPTGPMGEVNMTDLAAGAHDEWLTGYFANIKKAGISPEQMGTWVPLPEPNVPLWTPKNRTPQTFTEGVNHYLLAARKVYPNLQASVMLNAATYSADDTTWSNQQYLSLAPYLRGIKRGLVQSVGIQGFPWLPPANTKGVGSLDAQVFLDARIAKGAADTLGVRTIWLNTGTFAAQHTNRPSTKVAMAPDRRAQVLESITAQAAKLRKQGYDVAINLFAEDKSKASEGTDWSYFGSAEPILQDAIAKWQTAGVRLWLFDAE